MGAISLPFNIQTGDPLDPDPVMANDQAIVSAVNGGLEMGSNVKAAAPSASITGKDNTAGISTSGLRADAQFVIQGVENVTAKPTTGNFLGRMVYITAGGDIGKAFICTNTSIPTWLAFANMAATDVPVHAAQHKPGGDDPLADNTVNAAMRASQTVSVAQLGSTTGTISTSTFTDIIDLSVTTTGVQTLAITVHMNFHVTPANPSNKPSVYMRVQDHLDGIAPAVTIYRSNFHQLGINGGGSDSADLDYSFFYTVPATGVRTLRLQAGSDVGSVVVRTTPTSPGPGGDNTAAVSPTMSAVIL